MSTPRGKPPLTQRLLERAHSPNTAAQIHTTKFVHKPLYLLPTASKETKRTAVSSDSLVSNKHGSTHTQKIDARSIRQERRKANKLERQNRNKKGKGSKLSRPKPLTAAEKRKLCIYDIPKDEQKYELYRGLHKLWCGYIREILGVGKSSVVYVTGTSGGAILASADFHGAELEVVRSRCVGRVGTKGVVVRDTMFTFVVITKKNEVKTIPKEHTIFRFEVPTADEVDVDQKAKEAAVERPVGDVEQTSTIPHLPSGTPKALIFELHGEQFKNRAPDRANKKFKMHLPDDL